MTILHETLVNNNSVNIVMLGASGVGKTSLVAAMYPSLMTHFPSSDYKLVPEENTKKRLDELVNSLKELGEGGVFVPREEKGIENSPNAMDHEFHLQYEGRTDVKLHIWDLPGAYYTEDDGKQAIEFLNMADVTFWCIDSVSFMELSDVQNDKVNAAQKVINVFANSNINSPHSFIVALMCCEKWEQDGRMQELFDKFKDKFAQPLIKICRDRRIGHVYYTAVQTTGNLRINSFEGDSPLFIRHQGRTYNPRNCELPVLCALQQSIHTVISKSRDILERSRMIPFVRVFQPAYWKTKEKIKRLKKQLSEIEQAIKEHNYKSEADKRLFEW